MNPGWDIRPEKGHCFPWSGAEADWSLPPTPVKLAYHLQLAIDWVGKHPDACEANAVLIYA